MEILLLSQQSGEVKQQLTTPGSSVVSISKCDQERFIQQTPVSYTTDFSQSLEFDSKDIQPHTGWPDPSQVLESFSGKSFNKIYPLPQQRETSQEMLPSKNIAVSISEDVPQQTSDYDTSVLSYSIESGDQPQIDRPTTSQISEMVVGKSLMKIFPSPHSGDVKQERAFVMAMSKIMHEGLPQQGPSDDTVPEHASKEGGWLDSSQVSETMFGKSIMRISQSSEKNGTVQQQTVSAAKSIDSQSGKTFPQQTMHCEASVSHRVKSDVKELQAQVDLPDTPHVPGSIQKKSTMVISPSIGYLPQSGRDQPQTITSEYLIDIPHDVPLVESFKGDQPQSITSERSEHLIDIPRDVLLVESFKGKSSKDISLIRDTEIQRPVSAKKSFEEIAVKWGEDTSPVLSVDFDSVIHQPRTYLEDDRPKTLLPDTSIMPDKVRKREELQWEDSPERIQASDSYTEEMTTQGSVCQGLAPFDKSSIILESRLTNLDVKTNDTAQFTCKFDDPDFSKIVWYHNGTELIYTDRVRLAQNGGEVTLTIWNVQPEDQGTYSCLVKNRQGERRTSAQLMVEGGYSFKEDCHFISFHCINLISW